MLTSVLIVVGGTLSALRCENKDIAVIAVRVFVQMFFGFILIIDNCQKDFAIYNKTFWVRTLKFNIPLIPYYMSMVILNSSDRIIISRIVNSEAAGIYSVAYTVSMCMLLLSSSINGVIQPWLYENMKKNKTESISQIIEISFLLVAICNLFVIGLAPELIGLAAPIQYREAIWVLPPLAASVVVMYFYQHFVNIEFYFEDSKLTAIASCGAAILNIILNIIFIPQYGYLAAGYTTLVSYLLFGFSHYFFMKLICKKNKYSEKLIDIGRMTGILIAFFIMAAIEMIGYQYTIIRFTVLIFIIVCAVIKRDVIAEMLLLGKKNRGRDE